MSTTHDSHLAKSAEVAVRQAAAEQVETALPEPFPSVPVRDEAAALGTWRSVFLTANNPVQQLLPQDPRRRSALVVSDSAKTVVCSSADLANYAHGVASTTDVQGFVLPSGIIVPVHNKAACRVTYASDATPPIHISILVEKDDE